MLLVAAVRLSWLRRAEISFWTEARDAVRTELLHRGVDVEKAMQGLYDPVPR
jgi:hypothetical protein